MDPTRSHPSTQPLGPAAPVEAVATVAVRTAPLAALTTGALVVRPGDPAG